MNAKRQFEEFLETAVLVGAFSEETKDSLIQILFNVDSNTNYIQQIVQKVWIYTLNEQRLYTLLVNKGKFSPWTADMYVTPEWLWLAFKQFQENRFKNR